MKRYIFTLFIIGITFLSFVMPTPTHAQTKNEQLFVVTPFERGQNLSFFFANSSIPLEYFEVEDAEPMFLSIITPVQLDLYKKEGYKPVVIDQSVESLNQYYLLYGKRMHNKDQYELLLDDVQRRQGLEFAYPVTNYTTLVKIADNMNFDQLKATMPDLQRAKPRQLSVAITPPPSRTTQSAVTPIAEQSQSSPLYGFLSGLVIIAVISTFAIQLKNVK